MDALRLRAESIARGLASGDVDAAEARATVLALVHELERAAALREAHEQQLSVQRELLDLIAYPILRVRKDTLCVPLIGPVDADRTAALTEGLLAAVVRTRARLVVLDLSGAVVHDPRTADHLGQVLRALQLLGARGVLSGVSAEAASLMVDSGDRPPEVAVYHDLAAALAASERPR